MSGRIIINIERCKGCGLCITVCPQKGIVASKSLNKSGHHPAEKNSAECTGCAVCAIICPDTAIEVARDKDPSGVKAEAGRKER